MKIINNSWKSNHSLCTPRGWLFPLPCMLCLKCLRPNPEPMSAILILCECYKSDDELSSSVFRANGVHGVLPRPIIQRFFFQLNWFSWKENIHFPLNLPASVSRSSLKVGGQPLPGYNAGSLFSFQPSCHHWLGDRHSTVHIRYAMIHSFPEVEPWLLCPDWWKNYQWQ